MAYQHGFFTTESYGKGSPYRSVMVLLDFSKIGAPDVSSNPLRIGTSFNSCRMGTTSSSRVICPLSTHCKAAIEVMSLEHEARRNVDSKVIEVSGVA